MADFQYPCKTSLNKHICPKIDSSNWLAKIANASIIGHRKIDVKLSAKLSYQNSVNGVVSKLPTRKSRNKQKTKTHKALARALLRNGKKCCSIAR